jgi:hypothetical protein
MECFNPKAGEKGDFYVGEEMRKRFFRIKNWMRSKNTTNVLKKLYCKSKSFFLTCTKY